MTRSITVIVLVISWIACLVIGYAIKSVQVALDNRIQEKAMAYGFNEASNVWNRIRVNDKGQVVCVKEQ